MKFWIELRAQEKATWAKVQNLDAPTTPKMFKTNDGRTKNGFNMTRKKNLLCDWDTESLKLSREVLLAYPSLAVAVNGEELTTQP